MSALLFNPLSCSSWSSKSIVASKFDPPLMKSTRTGSRLAPVKACPFNPNEQEPILKEALKEKLFMEGPSQPSQAIPPHGPEWTLANERLCNRLETYLQKYSGRSDVLAQYPQLLGADLKHLAQEMATRFCDVDFLSPSEIDGLTSDPFRLLRLDLNDDPLKEWLQRTVEASGITEEEINADSTEPEDEVPQQIAIE